MAKELTDDEQNLKIKARRRLIGAVALTLAVVVILPMLLESEPKSGGQNIELQIPSIEQLPPPVSTLPVPEPAASEVTVEPASALPDIAATPAAQPLEPSVADAKSDAPTPAEGKPVAAAETPVASSATPADGTSYALQVGAYSNTATAKKQYEQLKGWHFKAYTEKAGETTRVRVGPYTDREKVDKVAKMLENHGLKPAIVTIK